MEHAEAIRILQETIEHDDTGRCPSCGWNGCRDFLRCVDCGEALSSSWSTEHKPDCVVTKIIVEFGDDILDEAF